jgi:hypothetical protein
MFGNKILTIGAEISEKGFEHSPCSPIELKTLSQTIAAVFFKSITYTEILLCGQ